MDLTITQLPIYKMSVFGGGSIANICGSLLIEGKKEVDFLKDVVNRLFELNDGLRIQIYEDGGIPKQRILPYKRRDVKVLYFSSCEELYSYADLYAKQPVSIEKELCEIQIAVLPDKFGIIPKLHHLIGDAWAFILIGTQFNALVSGETPEVFSFVDYVEKANAYIKSKRFSGDAAYLENKLISYKDPVYISDLRTSTFISKRKTFIINQNADKINSFANQREVSVFSVFFSVLAIYFSSVKMNTESICIGTSVLNRSGHEEKNTIASYVNTVPVFIELNDNLSFCENMKNVQSAILSAMRHQKYNYQLALENLKKKNINIERPYDIIINYQNAKIKGEFSESTWHHNGMQTESLQIQIEDRNNEGVFHIHYDYQIDKFSEHDIDMLHGHLCVLLDSVIDNYDATINNLDMLLTCERQKLLKEFNDTATEYAREKCVHELFEEMAAKTPDKVAVVACDKTLTYKELNEDANRIAHSLMEKGIGKGNIVGLMLPRESYLLSALFGVLKTGAAYLPIDSVYPAERIDFMLFDSGVKCCITEENISGFLDNANTENPVNTVCSEDICYCIYTSGSTGKPKGTLITHRNVVNYVSANKINVFYGITGEDAKSILCVTTTGFDIFVTETILPLVNGMEVILADEEQSKVQNRLVELLEKHPADILQTTPTKMKSFLADKTQLDYLKNFKSIILGGEILDSPLVRELKNLTKAEIYNIYGPAETTVWVTKSKIKNADDISIGRPMANTQVYIVDKHMKLVPIGVTGELCIAGDSVSAGYLNRPDLTAEKFVNNPFGEGKLYKTGDLAYWREDGNIVFVGRSDFQVKIRGLRIELGEIESALQQAEDVERAVVVVRKDREGRQLICAFYTGQERSAKELREEIGKSLPKYMVPHIFTHLEKMPLTTSGKADRKALPEIDLENISTGTEYIAPGTAEEIVLTGCVQNVLGKGKISILDNFFDIGGDSLKAIELIAALESKGYDVPVKTIFGCKDICELAKALKEKDTEYIKSEYGKEVPATAAQMRVYTSQMLAPDSTLYNVTFAFKAEQVEKQKLERAVNILIERHESLRTYFENRGGVIYQVIDENTVVEIETLDEENLDGFAKAFKLNKSPLMRVGCNNNTVIIDMHHTIVDGETMPVFFKELNELYMGRSLSENVVQYGEFAVQQTNTEKSENYWLDIFKEETPALELPADYQRGSVQSFNGNIHYKLIEKSLHEKIEEKCRQRGITPYVYYMACFSILLSKLSGNEDIVIGSPISGRTSRFLYSVGMFVNTIALRSRPEGNKTVLQLMEEIKEDSIDAIDNQNYPFGELVKKLGIEAGGRNPLFDVMLSYQSYEMTDITFGDEKVELLPLTGTAAKCDMTFTVLPRKDDVVLATEYCTDLFKEERIEKFTSMYIHILKLCLDTNNLIKDISAIDEEETKQLLFKFNDTVHTYKEPEGATLYSLFEKRAKENSEKTCIKTAEINLNYGELLRISENLDAEIRKITGDKKSVVAVIAERSVEMYSAIYGIIRGGNAYLPIDPEYPRERIEYILKDSNAVAVIAQGKFVYLTSDIPCIDMTDLMKKTTEAAVSAVPTVAEENDTAYVIYTSGSTGNPKGAKVSHKSAVNRILWMQDKYPLEENGVILQKTPYTFDVSVWELFWWGICDGSLAFSKPGEHFLPAKILNETHSNKVTHIHFVPSVFELFLNYLESHQEELYKFNSVRYVFLSGEALNASLVQRFYKLYDYNKVTLHNLYGPAECAVDVTYYDCKPTDIDPLPIGKPIYNTQIYVVDNYTNLVPIGVTGQLCISGRNVGQGYLNRPDLTAEKFVDNPFGEGKLYKTGDLAYWREDGNIVFVGRSDFQVKLGGQRIEIGEIESVISGIDAVDSVAVVINKTGTRDVLVAFYSGRKGSERLIKSTCSTILPKYMVPSAIVHLDKLPLNSSGKLDRKVLAQKKLELVGNVDDDTPLTVTEKFICETFKTVLGENDIGRNSNFFECGGTSLSMISLLSKNGFENISAAEFMRNPTPEKLSIVMQNKNKTALEYMEPLLMPDRATRAFVLLPFAGGGAEAYSNFVNALKCYENDTAIYFIRYLHSFDECKKAAKEIADVLSCKEIYFYSHCVGSAVALQLLKLLENEGIAVKHYFAGASIPPSKPTNKNIWRIVPDNIIRRILIKAKAQLGNLSHEKLAELLNRFREDTDFSNISYTKFDRKVKVPVSVILSKNDIFTKNYRQTEKLWNKYAENVARICYIETDSHYFQSENSQELVEILMSECE